MKINSKVTELLCNLSEIESLAGSHFTSKEAADLRKSLLKLYRSTVNPESRDTIVAIMTEAGYPWFGKLARSGMQSIVSSSEKQNEFMSEDDFLDLLPINGHFH